MKSSLETRCQHNIVKTVIEHAGEHKVFQRKAELTSSNFSALLEMMSFIIHEYSELGIISCENFEKLSRLYLVM